jgi:hypothetical protein
MRWICVSVDVSVSVDVTVSVGGDGCVVGVLFE